MKKIFDFLSVDEFVNVNTNLAYNKSGDVRLKTLHHFLRNKESRFRRNIGKVFRLDKIILSAPCIADNRQV